MAGASRAAEDAAPVADAALEVVRYKAPAGWQLADRPGQSARVYTSADSNATSQAVILIVLAPIGPGVEFGAAFDAAVKEVTGSGKVLEAGEVTPAKTRQGFDALSRTVVTQGAGDQRVYARMVAAKVENRMAGIYYLATSEELYNLHQADMAALLKSVSFDGAAAGAPANPLGAAGATGEVEALERQRQALLKQVAEIEARQRQLGAAAAAAVPGGAAAAAADDSEQLLAKARERFAKEVSGRRKAHTISGDILGLDGKPIPDVAAYRVSVWGTTIAAERTRYGLDVDANGHFEQQVPDGLYQILATCIVTNAGHRVPVDLVWLDDKKVGVDQASAGGIVRDFRLVAFGLKPGADAKAGNAYFGGVLVVNGPTYDVTRGTLATRYPNATVRLTLTPQGPQVDGARRAAFTIDIGVADVNYGSRRRGIPLGTYRVSATLVAKDGGTRALTCAREFAGEYGESADVFWEGKRDDAEALGDAAIYLKD